MPSLAHTQQLVWTLLTAPEGVAAGLARLDPIERGIAEALVRPGGRLAPLERLDVYADMYFYRLRDCLQEDFVAVRAVIGETRFHNLITDYLLAHPPAHFSLRYAGQHLPAFLGRHVLTDEWPFLPDLATLEWAIVDAFDAPDAPPIDAAALAQVPEARWPALRLALTPSLQLLRVEWPVHEVWRAVQDAATPPVVESRALWLRVWRQDLRVFHRPVDAAEAAALAAIAADARFADVCERITEVEPNADAERGVQLLSTWFADGVLTGHQT